MSRVLVTGGAGFIGSHLVDALLAAGHLVTVIDDFSSGREDNLRQARSHPNFSLHQIDINDSLEEIFAQGPFETIFHLAAQANVQKSIEDPVADARTNILGTINLLQNTVKFGVKKFVFTSSVAVFGEPEYLPVDEDHPSHPLSPYGASKKAAEDYIRHFQKAHHLSADILVLGNVYGPRQDPFGEGGVIAIFTQEMVSGGQPAIYGTGEQTRDFVYVRDVVRALLSCQNLTKEDTVRRFVIGTGNETAVKSVYQSLKKLTRFDRDPRHLPERAGEIRAMHINSDKAISILGWHAEINIEEGLEKTVAWFIETAGAK